MHTEIFIGQRNLNTFSHHWQQRDDIIDLFKKPTLLFLPGANATVAQVNGALKKIAISLYPQQDLNLFGCYYAHINAEEHRSSILQRIHQQSDFEFTSFKNPENVNKHCENLFQRCFNPLFFNQKKPSIEELTQKLKNLTIITHCYGSLVAFEIEQLLLKKLQQLFYTSTEQKKILQHLNIINYASRVPLGFSKTNTIHILSLSDHFWLGNWKKDSFNAFINDKIQQHLSLNHFQEKNMYFIFSPNESILLTPRLSSQKNLEHYLNFHLPLPEMSFYQTIQAKQLTTCLKILLSLKTQKPDMTFTASLKTTFDHLPDKTLFQNLKKQYIRHQIHCRLGRTLLHYAVRQNQQKILEILIHYQKIPVNLKDASGIFAPAYAVQQQNLTTLKTLLTTLSYDDIHQMSGLTEKQLWKEVLKTNNIPLIHLFFSEFQQKNKHRFETEILPNLQTYCLNILEQDKPCAPLLLLSFQGNSRKSLLLLAQVYQKSLSFSSPNGLLHQQTLLQLAQNAAIQNISLYSLGETSFIKQLKEHHAPAKFIDVFNEARCAYILSNQKKINILLSQLNNYYDKGISLPLFQVLPFQQKQREQDYLDKIDSFLFVGGRNKTQTRQIMHRLEKRYTQMSYKIIAACMRERES